jgi:hypothetical protein
MLDCSHTLRSQHVLAVLKTRVEISVFKKNQAKKYQTSLYEIIKGDYIVLITAILNCDYITCDC